MIIIADDNRDQVDTLTDILESDGYQVEGVYDGEQAIDLINRYVRENIQIDLVITDMYMPNANGLDVAVAAKKAGAKKIIINSSDPTGIPPMEGVTIIDKSNLLEAVAKL